MNTQDTKVHIRLWHKDFWFMALANLLLTISVYSLIPILPKWLSPRAFDLEHQGIALAAFGLGVLALGCFCSYLVQRFRRNKVCLIAIAATALCSFVLYYVSSKNIAVGMWSLVALRFFHGAFYGLAKMVLASTLIIDTCESFHRTEANYSSAWFARFALSLGPVVGITCASTCGYDVVFLISALSAIVSLLLVRAVSFPFRAPEENVRLLSLDRFFLPQGMVLFANLLLISTVVGLLLSVFSLPFSFYGFIMCGFLLALLAEKFVFANADLKSEAVSGLLFIVAAFLIMLFPTPKTAAFLAPTFFGLGIGITASRFLLFFIKLSRHCQRGTSQSTYMVGWELGVAAGLFIGLALLHASWFHILLSATTLTILALVVYVAYTHTWFVNHKNR